MDSLFVKLQFKSKTQTWSSQEEQEEKEQAWAKLSQAHVLPS